MVCRILGRRGEYIYPSQAKFFFIEVCQSITGKNRAKTVKGCFLEIKKHLGGHVYEYSNPCKLLRWRCYKKECTKKICKDILPYLRIRKKEIKSMLAGIDRQS